MRNRAGTAFFIPTEKELRTVFGLKASISFEGFLRAFYKDAEIVVTGIGKSNASLTAALYLSLKRPSKAVLIGICGAYRESGLKPGDLVSVEYDHFIDEASFDGQSLVTLHEKGMSPYENNAVKFKVWESLEKVSANTVSLIQETDEISSLYRQKTGAAIESMEGAAFGAAAIKLGAEPYQIRAVSNFCGARPRQEWNIKLAAVNLKSAADILIDKL